MAAVTVTTVPVLVQVQVPRVGAVSVLGEASHEEGDNNEAPAEDSAGQVKLCEGIEREHRLLLDLELKLSALSFPCIWQCMKDTQAGA